MGNKKIVDFNPLKISKRLKKQPKLSGDYGIKGVIGLMIILIRLLG